MNYSQAIKKSLLVEWEIGTCPQGDQCWCRIIKPIIPIFFKDGDCEEEYHILRGGELHKEIVEHIIDLQNQNIRSKRRNG